MSDDTGRREPPSQAFVPVCAIGASAGGVAALQELFRQLPPNLGLAYVVILHLAPDSPSAMHEILGACTRMPVLQIDDGPTLRPNCVFVIPPDRELVIDGDSVAARPFTEPRGQRAPIDLFFRSVAAGRGDGVAIILSGAGADGAAGVRAVKEAGGVIMVQEPAEADFPSMPQNAIAAGVADFVAPLARLAERLAEVAHSKEAVRSLDMDGGANDLRRIVAFLRARTGHDFSGYKRATVMRRVVRRMQVCRTDTLAAYADHLLTTPEESKELFSDLLISVTMFFRDALSFAALERYAVKPIFDDLEPDPEQGVRVWVVGCATGEEAYSLAILLHEEAHRRKLHAPVQIFATDLDDGALATAREGRYPRAIEADVSETRLARFFVDEGTHYRVRKELRESVLFATHSVIREPPFLRLDLISCRNLLIYLERAVQQQLCSIFQYSLKPGRFLFLGSAETADVAADLFAPVDREARIYSVRPHAMQTLPILPQFATPERLTSTPAPARMRAVDAALPAALHVAALEQTAPASALVNGEQSVIHLSPSVGRFILLSAGPVSNLLPTMVRPELRLDLRLALARALEAGQPTLTHPVVTVLEGRRHRVSMHVMPVPGEHEAGAQALVFFLDGGSVPDSEGPEAAADPEPGEIRRLHAELKAAQEALIASRSGHEATIQDLRTANEELQSTNEEYRSTAEELETSKEELQSINEELHTVNAELKSKLASISVAHSDLQNLTTATDIGTLFLDADLRIKMFTPPIAELFNITRADIGRTVTDFTHRLQYDAIEEDARRVLRDLGLVEREVRSKSGQWYAMRLRPYRTLEDRIDGTVVTFVDVTVRRRAEAALRASQDRQAFLLNLSDALRLLADPVAIEGDACKLLAEHLQADRAYYVEVDEARGTATVVRDYVRGGAASLAGEHPVASFSWSVEILRRGECHVVADTQVSPVVPAGDRAALAALQISACLGAPLIKAGTLVGALCVAVAQPHVWADAEVDLLREVGERIWAAIERARAEAALRNSEARLAAVFESLPVGIGVLGVDGVFVLSNPVLHRFVPNGVIPSRDTQRQERWRGWHPDGRPVETHDFPGARALRGESVVPGVEMLYRQDDGREVWTSITTVPIRDAEGRIRGSACVIADTDATKRAAEALRRSEERFRGFAENSADVLWIADSTGTRLEYLSPAFDKVFGEGREAVLADLRRWRDLVHPDDREAASGFMARALAGEVAIAHYRVIRPKDGRLVHLRDTGFPVRNEDDAITRAAGIVQDVTDMVAAQEALEAEKERFRTLAEGIPQLVWRASDNGLWTWSSPQWRNYTGQSETQSHDWGWLEAIHPDDRDATVQAWYEALPHGRLDVEYRVLRAQDDTWRWHQTRAVPVRGAPEPGEAEGPVREWLGTNTDIEDLKRLQGQQQMLVAELQHRTRNLLAVVRNVARRSIDPSPERDQYDARLSALGRVQGFLSRSPAYAVPLADLLDAELAAVGDGTSDRVTVDGPAVELPGESVQAVALALHELATNAVKYGAIAQASGRLSVTWHVEAGTDGDRRLVIDWHENGVEMSGDPPARRGYGSELITQALPYQLRAETSLQFTRDGVRCRMTLPSNAFSIHPGREPA